MVTTGMGAVGGKSYIRNMDLRMGSEVGGLGAGMGIGINPEMGTGIIISQVYPVSQVRLQCCCCRRCQAASHLRPSG